MLLVLLADDTKYFLDNNKKSVNEDINTVDMFSDISGFKANNDNTQLVV